MNQIMSKQFHKNLPKEILKIGFINIAEIIKK